MLAERVKSTSPFQGCIGSVVFPLWSPSNLSSPIPLLFLTALDTPALQTYLPLARQGRKTLAWNRFLQQGSGCMGTGPGTPVPLCDLQAQYQTLRPELEQALSRVLASGQVIQGPEVAGLEEEVARYCGAAYGVGCSSGTDALLLALQALDIGPGDEVILPTFSFFASAGTVCRLGARPVFVDIDAATFNLDPLQVENKVTSRTRAIMAVHLFGQCADMEGLWQVAERYELPIIEDAAQAFGAEYQGKKTGTLGAIGCFSFYPSKILGAYGDAGMVVTSDPDWAGRMACLRVHGMEVKYEHRYLGWNARLDALHAALLRVKLGHVERWIEARRSAALRYDALIEEHQLGQFQQRPAVGPQRRHVFNQYVVRVAGSGRDALLAYLKSEHIGCEIYYPVPLHRQPCLRYLGYRNGDFPATEAACREVLALPMFPEITPLQQQRVIQSCAAFLRQQARKAA
jgi:dTDP-4-amino-4,6-dideoxygalactose transaminase